MVSSALPGRVPAHDARTPRSLTACSREGTTVLQEPLHATKHSRCATRGKIIVGPHAFGLFHFEQETCGL